MSSRHSGSRLRRHFTLGQALFVLAASFTVGFYLALLIVAIIADFNAMLPMPWRMLTLIPSAVVTVWWWLIA